MNEDLPEGAFAARKLPVVIVAVLVTLENVAAVCEWAGGTGLVDPGEISSADQSIFGFDLVTLEGPLRVRPGQYVLRGIEGEFYPCKASIFEASYEHVETDR